MAGTRGQWNETEEQGYFLGVLWTAFDMKSDAFTWMSKKLGISEATDNRYELTALAREKDRSSTVIKTEREAE